MTTLCIFKLFMPKFQINILKVYTQKLQKFLKNVSPKSQEMIIKI